MRLISPLLPSAPAFDEDTWTEPLFPSALPPLVTDTSPPLPSTLSPALTDTAPPTPEDPLPTESVMEPPAPPDETPDVIEKEPDDDAPVAVPVFMAMAPLLPSVPELAELMLIRPDADCFDIPEAMTTLPPVKASL